MIIKTTKLEKELGYVTIVFLSFQIVKHLSTEQMRLISIYILSVLGLFIAIKIARFFTMANKAIKIIWLASLSLIITGVALIIINNNLGTGIAVIGTAAFWQTWHYSFLANRPDIQ